MVLIFEVPTCAIFNIIENDFFSIQGLKFFNIGSSGYREGQVLMLRNTMFSTLNNFRCYSI